MGGGKGGGSAMPPAPKLAGTQFDGSKISRNADGTWNYGDTQYASREDLFRAQAGVKKGRRAINPRNIGIGPMGMGNQDKR